MKSYYRKKNTKPRRYMEWFCCGNVWTTEISASKRRAFFEAPTCPDCGKVGDSYNDLKQAEGYGLYDMEDPPEEESWE